MQYDQKQFTQAGLNMFSSALSNKQSITVDKVIVDDLPTNNFSNLALLSLDSFADAMSFQANYTETLGNTLTVDAVMSNKGFTSSYTINELGLVGHVGDDANNQSLMAVLVASDPFTLPAQQNNETPSQFIPNVTIQLANNDMGQVPVLVQDDAYIAQKDLDKLVADNGYIKLTDADNRYVKQTDFDNEVNGAVNEKADKSDLSNLQSNINNDVQPQLNQKADQSDLNTTNSNVSSLQSNKADKGDVNGQINQTLSQATAHSDQNLSTANSHSDSNYNDLSNKNNILSQKMEDYQKPNLAPQTKYWLGGNATWTAFSIQVEKGKKYCLRCKVHATFNGGFTTNSQIINQEDFYWGNGNYSFPYNYSKLSFTAKEDGNVPITFSRTSAGDLWFDEVSVTQSEDYVPVAISEQNKAFIASKPHNLAPFTNATWNWWNYKFGDNNYQISVEKGKTYWFSCYVENGDANISSIDLNNNNYFSAIGLDVNTGNSTAASGNYFVTKWVSDRTGLLHVSLSSSQGGGGSASKICITQSNEYIPFEQTDSTLDTNSYAPFNYVDNQISNKTNDLSNTMSQQFSQAENDISSLRNNTDDKYSEKYVLHVRGEINEGDNISNLIYKPGVYTFGGLFGTDLSKVGTTDGLSGIHDYHNFDGYLVVRNIVGNTIRWDEEYLHGDSEDIYVNSSGGIWKRII